MNDLEERRACLARVKRVYEELTQFEKYRAVVDRSFSSLNIHGRETAAMVQFDFIKR